MKTAWSEERLGYQPSQFEKVNDNTYIQRRNIRRDTLTEDSTESEPGWICESRFISDDIYEDFMEVMNSPAQEQIVNNFTAIQNTQMKIQLPSCSVQRICMKSLMIFPKNWIVLLERRANYVISVYHKYFNRR